MLCSQAEPVAGLNPLTRVTNKHLLPIYDKPMVYYPIQTLVNAGIEEILLVTGGKNAGDFLRLLGNGRDFGLKHMNYTYQEGEGGIAEALGLAEYFAGDDPICVILGDNIIENNICQAVENFKTAERRRENSAEGSRPTRSALAWRKFAVITWWASRKSPRPRNPITPSLEFIFMIKACFEKIRRLKPSGRGELEITDVNNFYIEERKAHLRSPRRLVDRCGNVRVSAARQ